MTTEIRPATIHDLGAIAAVQLRAALTGYVDIFPPDAPTPSAETLDRNWRQMFEDGGEVLVALSGGVIIGSVAVVAGDVPRRVLLTKLYVEPEEWGRGVGTDLHDAALDLAATAGHRWINLWVLEDNARARNMYEARGWRLVDAHVLDHEGAGVVEVLYERPLVP